MMLNYKSGTQLYHKLITEVVHQRNAGPPLTTLRRVPEPGNSPSTGASPKDYLPGLPRVRLLGPDLGRFLERELLTEDLDRLLPHLWLVATQDSAHVSSLTEQLVRGRQICLTERPELHLVWYYDRVFIKPLPKYLLSHAFWQFLQSNNTSALDAPQRARVVRTYAHLVRHRSDFALAMRDDCRLLPKNTKYASFVKLVAAFADVNDGDVSPRYHFGELRLSRLNFWTKVYLWRFTYQKTSGQYGAYFARFFGPILFVFAVFSVLLSAMQVVLAAQPLMETDKGSWGEFATASRGFSIFTLVAAVGTFGVLLVVLLVMILRETVFACKDLYRKSRIGI